MERESAWKKYNESDLQELERLAAKYREFISLNKTERACVTAAIQMAEEVGYVSLEQAIRQGSQLQAGDKVWAQAHGKALILVQLGSDCLSLGFNIIGSHVDSPRLDIKQNPLYEANDFALLDTHYYGGIKHYQWVTVPLALHGVVVKTDGTVIDVQVGDSPDDPVFCVTDLLIHLASQQMSKKAAEVVEGEALDLLIGNRPLVIELVDEEGIGNEAVCATDDTNAPAYEKLAKKEPVKAFALKLLFEKYDMSEEDFLSAELEVVPAGSARDLGFDRSMIIGYGQDDRVCAYTSLVAQLELAQQELERSVVCILVDKEEIGSVGATGMTSRFFESTIAEIMELAGVSGPLLLARSLAASRMISSDVAAGFDPAYAGVFEAKNSAFMGRGLVFAKYTGARGKSGSNDARAEYMARIRSIMEEAQVSFQTSELGRVDAGGGGTIAYIPAEYGMDVIDAGVAVLSMHSPWEVTSKADIFEAYKGYKAFLKYSQG